ncbi:hypothetical protein [Actinokineospora sp. HUAS TT18]|uniref:hypothetical protein n=1 Tax=Actinokineospora sp. HUAS TT18 TaxID=3447451 RepID=UPI003F522699
MASAIGTVKSGARYGDIKFPVPRLPIIRLWAMKAHYPNAPWIQSYSGNFQIPQGFQAPFEFTSAVHDSDVWTTADRTDIVFLRDEKSVMPSEGWIYLSLGETTPRKYTVYVYDDGKNAGTMFGTYTDEGQKPIPFPEGSDNYVYDMSDSYGNWLWGYNLYGPVS